jgi:hypothetical protein
MVTFGHAWTVRSRNRLDALRETKVEIVANLLFACVLREDNRNEHMVGRDEIGVQVLIQVRCP